REPRLGVRREGGAVVGSDPAGRPPPGDLPVTGSGDRSGSLRRTSLMAGSPFSRRARALLGVAALSLSGAACGGCTSEEMGIEPTKAEDQKATKAHFEEAAQTYYEGGKYERSVQQWKKVLEEAP